MGRPSRPKFGRRGHVNTGSSGCVGVVAVTLAPMADATAPAAAPGTFWALGLVTEVGFTDEPGAGGAVRIEKKN